MKKIFTLRLVAIALAAVGLLCLSACTTADIKDVWTAPNLTNLKFQKVLVIAATRDGSDGVTRRTAEDAITRAIPSLHPVPGYTFITTDELQDAAKSSAAIKAAGFDGLIVMRMVSERTEVHTHGYYDPYGYGPYGYGPYGYRPYGYGHHRHGYYGYGFYGYGPYGHAGMGLGPTVTTSRIFSIETNIYEFPSEKLIWSGMVESTSPGSIKQMVDDTVAAVLDFMVKQKLIPAPVKS